MAPFKDTDAREYQVTLRCVLERPTPRVDFEFPLYDVESPTQMLSASKVSSNLAAWSLPLIEERTTDVLELPDEVAISEDLFEPLGRPRTGGKQYPKRAEETEAEPDRPLRSAQIIRDKDGYRKAFRETTTGSDGKGKVTERQQAQIWDLILPLLEPPLDYEFTEFFDLPHDLYPFQPQGVKFLFDRECALLGDEMGLGKTVQAVVAMRALFQKGMVSSALVVAPLSLQTNWDDELLKWAQPLSVTVVRGTPEKRSRQWELPAHVWISTYGTVRQDVDEITRLRSFDLVVADEVQAIKNPDSDQSKAVRRLRRNRAWGLSGTPIENKLDDLCSVFEFIKPGLLNIPYLRPERAKVLIEPYFLRRRKVDVLKDLPEKRVIEEWVVLEEEQREAYDAAEEEGVVYLRELGAEVTLFHVLQLLMKLKQICNRDPRTGKSAKLELLNERLEQALGEEEAFGDSHGPYKALVYSQYKSEGVEFITSRFGALYKPAVVTGDQSAPSRHAEVTRFQTDPECRLFVATPKAGGLGLTLTAGNYVFHFDHWWNPATVLQAEDRVHRIGQNRGVFVYHFWAKNTVEERVYRILERKQVLFDEVIGPLSNVEGTGLSGDDLFEVLGLKRPGARKVPASPDGGTEGLLRKLVGRGAAAFEQFIAKFYEAQGYSVRVTPQSRDKGLDVVAQRLSAGTGTQKLAIQCKCYDPSNRVGRPHCQQLLGVIADDKTYTKGILVTTSDFTAECRQFAEGNGRLALMSGADLERQLLHLHEEKRLGLEALLRSSQSGD